MISAIQKDGDLLRDIASRRPEVGKFDLWWLGQSGFLVAWNGKHLLFDPYLSDSLSRKYAETDKPHVRMTERVVDPAKLIMVDVATSSHNHTDHLDAETLGALSRANPKMKLVLPWANFGFARERLGGDAPEFVGLDEGTTAQVGEFRFHGISAAHNEVERDDEERCKFLGFVVEFGPFAIYHSGDTLWHPTLVKQLVDFDLDLALVPINGNKPERRVAGNLNGTEAAALARAANAGIAVPHHFHMFEFNTEEPDEFVSACGRLEQECRVLGGGERMTVGASPGAED